jgi:hypothetical protein
MLFRSVIPRFRGLYHVRPHRTIMDTSNVLSNQFKVAFDEASKTFQIVSMRDGKPTVAPIRITLETLLSMNDPQEACRWFGETILLLVPEARRSLFNLPEGA